MKNTALIIHSTDEKIRQLISRYQELKNRIERYENEIQKLKTIHEVQFQTIKGLEKKIEIIKLTGTIETTEGKVEAKTRINELVREIDKCIGLLNR